MKLTKDETEAVLVNIRRVLKTGKPWEDETLHHPAGAIIDAILEIEGMEKTAIPGGFDTNGWDYDWWQQFAYEGKKYTLSGSGYYGGHSFQLSDD